MKIPNASTKARLARAFSPVDTVRPEGIPNMPQTKVQGPKKKKLPNVGGLGGMTTKPLTRTRFK